MQFKVVYQTDITSINTMREEDLKVELANWKSKYDEAEQKYIEIKGPKRRETIRYGDKINNLVIEVNDNSVNFSDNDKKAIFALQKLKSWELFWRIW